jgi:prepilin-type N-terminal cleavage/methylation domain-containing protein
MLSQSHGCNGTCCALCIDAVATGNFVNKTVIIKPAGGAVHTAGQKVKRTDMNIRTSRKSGFTLVEIMIVVAIIGLLAAIAIPNFVRARTTSQMNACINNLRQIDGAKQQWALENHQPSTAAAPASTVIAPYLGRGTSGSFPTCPAQGTYGINAISTAPTCSVANHVLPP